MGFIIMIILQRIGRAFHSHANETSGCAWGLFSWCNYECLVYMRFVIMLMHWHALSAKYLMFVWLFFADTCLCLECRASYRCLTDPRFAYRRGDRYVDRYVDRTIDISIDISAYRSTYRSIYRSTYRSFDRSIDISIDKSLYCTGVEQHC